MFCVRIFSESLTQHIVTCICTLIQISQDHGKTLHSVEYRKTLIHQADFVNGQLTYRCLGLCLYKKSRSRVAGFSVTVTDITSPIFPHWAHGQEMTSHPLCQPITFTLGVQLLRSSLLQMSACSKCQSEGYFGAIH